MDSTILPTWRYRYRALFDELKQAAGDREVGIPREILNIMARWNEQAVIEDGAVHIGASRASSLCDTAPALPAVDMAAPSGMGTTGISVRISPEGELLVDGVAPGSPADKCGGAIASGDRIIAVDGTEIVPGMAAEDIAALIVGEAGRDVTLRFCRRGHRQLSPDLAAGAEAGGAGAADCRCYAGMDGDHEHGAGPCDAAEVVTVEFSVRLTRAPIVAPEEPPAGGGSGASTPRWDDDGDGRAGSSGRAGSAGRTDGGGDSDLPAASLPPPPRRRSSTASRRHLSPVRRSSSLAGSQGPGSPYAAAPSPVPDGSAGGVSAAAACARVLEELAAAEAAYGRAVEVAMAY